MRWQNPVILLLVLAALSGCAQDEPTAPVDDQTEPPEDETAPAPEPNTTKPVVPDTPPALNATLSISEGIVPFQTTLDVNVTDADDDAIEWVATLNGTEVAAGNASGMQNITVDAVGDHTVIVTATAAGNSSTVEINVTGIAPATNVDISDAEGDGTTDFLDLTRMEAWTDDADLVVRLHAVDVVNTADVGFLPWHYSVFVGGQRFSTFVYQVTSTWHHQGNEYLPSSTTVWDDQAETITMTLPLSLLETNGETAPFDVRALSGVGGLLVAPGVAEDDDLVPDSGTVVVP